MNNKFKLDVLLYTLDKKTKIGNSPLLLRRLLFFSFLSIISVGAMFSKLCTYFPNLDIFGDYGILFLFLLFVTARHRIPSSSSYILTSST